MTFVKWIIVVSVSLVAFFVVVAIMCADIFRNIPLLDVTLFGETFSLLIFLTALCISSFVARFLYKYYLVKNSNPLNIVSNTVSAVKDMTDSVSSKINERDTPYYALAEHEINAGKIDQGLWSQALVKADGNENKRKSEYIKLRVMQLKR